MNALTSTIALDHPLAGSVSDLDSVRQAVRAALPEINARAAQTEIDRQVPAANVALLRDAGLFRMVQPRAFGGLEQDFDALADLVIEISGACASTGWVCGLSAAHQWLVATFPAAAQQDVWGCDPGTLVCGSYAPTGSVTATEGGWHATGRWSFASGCDIAGWAVCGALLPPDAEGGKPTPAFLLLPASGYVIDDTWNTVGLSGTGSKTLVLDGAFIPAHRMLTFRDSCAGTAVETGNRLFNMPLLSSVASCLAAAAVGSAQGALDHYLQTTSRRVTRGAVAGSNNRMADFPTIQLRVAEAAASVDAARTILLRDLRDTTQTVRDGGLPTTEQRVTVRRGQAFAVSLAIRAAESLNASTGGQGSRHGQPDPAGLA